METFNQNTSTTPVKPESSNRHGKNGRVLGGLFIVAIGLFILARRAGMDLPYWLFSWATLWIAVGIYIGVRHSFKGLFWLIPVAIGGLLLFDEFYPYYDLDRYWFPILVIALGLWVMLKPGKVRSISDSWRNSDGAPLTSNEDILDSTVVFGSVKKNVISKNFKGGEAVSVFGGTEINLMQADLQGRIVLDLTMVFSGTKLIIPAHWKVQSEELVSIFGGIEDKRPLLHDASTVDQTKVVVLRGTCIFGGIDIKSY